ncbi:MAG: GIY-YIG nuclease family protein [Fusobacteriaceae bacterium]
MEQKKWYLYIIRCEDNSLYTGITTDIERRFQQHFLKKGAKYTKSHKVKKIEIVMEFKNRSEASKKEYFIKNLGKTRKEELIRDGVTEIKGILE